MKSYFDDMTEGELRRWLAKIECVGAWFDEGYALVEGLRAFPELYNAPAWQSFYRAVYMCRDVGGERYFRDMALAIESHLDSIERERAERAKSVLEARGRKDDGND